jgi:hypothetical protein
VDNPRDDHRQPSSYSALSLELFTRLTFNRISITFVIETITAEVMR